jgi:hypothetical protein
MWHFCGLKSKTLGMSLLLIENCAKGKLLNHFQLMLQGGEDIKVFASSLPINMHFLLLKSSYGNSKGKRKIINNARLRYAMLKVTGKLW